MPLETRHVSRRELRGPDVEILVVAAAEGLDSSPDISKQRERGKK